MVQELYVGTGGWNDYRKDKLPSNLRLQAYSKRFNFVEVNSTFYKIFHPKTLERWRRNVPEDFEFSVKCYKALTHKIGIRPVEDAFRIFNLMKQYCKILNAKILVMETPPSLKTDEKFVSNVSSFLNSVSLNDFRVAWEFRRKPEALPSNLVNLLRDLEIIHVVDLSWEDPVQKSNILYSRIFGNPKNEFRVSSYDLENITDKVTKSESKIAYLSTHTPRMVQDAERLVKMVLS